MDEDLDVAALHWRDDREMRGVDLGLALSRDRSWGEYVSEEEAELHGRAERRARAQRELLEGQRSAAAKRMALVRQIYD